MPTIDTSSFGKPVEVGKISRELKQLSDSDAGARTKASLINFAAYFQGTQRMQENTAMVAEFTGQHACRALLLCPEPDAPEPKGSAWINAHCHVTKAGAKQVCCEQVSFLFEGHSE